jgi:hypothetical protein
MAEPLNKEFIAFNLREAAESALKIVADLQNDSDYEIGNFWVDMEHLYEHLNCAWNARFSTDAEARACSEQDYERWSRLPDDLPTLSPPPAPQP